MSAIKKELNSKHGSVPDSFLSPLVAWGKMAPEEIFSPNPNPADIYALVHPVLGPWDPEQPKYRRAVMVEVMRVHAGLEADWNWNEAVDKSNASSQRHIEREETGVFQVSFDSLRLGGGALMDFARLRGIETPEKFIVAMKQRYQLALEYYARLVRVSVQWAGPLIRHEVNALLSREAVSEFITLL